MRVDVVTIFPDYLAPLGLSLIGKAQTAGLLDVRVHDLRAFTPPTGTARSTTRLRRRRRHGHASRAVGRGPGRAARRRVRVATPCWSSPRRPGGRSPRRVAEELAGEPRLVFACGRYEGIDRRVARGRRTGCACASCQPRRLRAGRWRGRRARRRGGGGPAAARGARQRGVPGRGEPRRRRCSSTPVYTKPPRVARARRTRRAASAGTTPRSPAGGATRRCGERRPRRPDLVAALDPASLAAADRALLAELGWGPATARVSAQAEGPVAH